MKRPPLLVLGDLHLGPIAPAGAENALVALLDRHPDRELVCLGDLFDLSALPATPDPHSAVTRRLAAVPNLARALRQHLLGGSPVTLVAGNHDAELALPGMREALLEAMDLDATFPLRVEPWWLQRDGLHLEHGHIWDPDNAPIHPLAPTVYVHEPLGIALTRQVLAPTGAFMFAHAHQTTPLAGLKRALSELGPRAPELIFRYFLAGASIFWEASCNGPARIQRTGDRALETYAKRQAVSTELLEQLTNLRPRPRQASARAVFARLYLDRALATLVATSSLTVGLASAQASLLVLAATGALYLAMSKGDRAHQYSASFVERIRSAAQTIGPIVKAKVVVFGHTHVPEAVAGYVNTGAFGFPGIDGRPYLLVETDGSLVRGYLDSQHNSRCVALPFGTN